MLPTSHPLNPCPFFLCLENKQGNKKLNKNLEKLQETHTQQNKIHKNTQSETIIYQQKTRPSFRLASIEKLEEGADQKADVYSSGLSYVQREISASSHDKAISEVLGALHLIRISLFAWGP